MTYYNMQIRVCQYVFEKYFDLFIPCPEITLAFSYSYFTFVQLSGENVDCLALKSLLSRSFNIQLGRENIEICCKYSKYTSKK